MNNTSDIARLLQDGLSQSGLPPEEPRITDYLQYLELLQQWNSAYNLTAIRDPEKMVTHHVFDSLSVLPYLHGDRCLDVGTGAGLPGLILALAEPDRHWVLLDSNHKKIRFVNQAIIELKLKNVETVCQRVEHYQTQPLFSTIVTRAFASLDVICRQTWHLLAPAGKLLSMKGGDIASELAMLDTGTIKVQTLTLTVPGIREERQLVEISALPSTN